MKQIAMQGAMVIIAGVVIFLITDAIKQHRAKKAIQAANGGGSAGASDFGPSDEPQR